MMMFPEISINLSVKFFVAETDFQKKVPNLRPQAPKNLQRYYLNFKCSFSNQIFQNM